MKTKDYKEKYSKKVKKKPIKNKKSVDHKWIAIVTVSAFLISIVFSFASELIMPNATAIIATITILLFIGIGILFDIIGIAITVADISTFNSMATKRVRGAKIAVKLIGHSEKAASFCNDVIGDICGIISGSAGVALSSIISNRFNINILLITLIITGIIAALTIGGKAVGKHFAINKSTVILFNFSKVLSFFYREK
jgi:CBS domain containing-hemolysin-like protein